MLETRIEHKVRRKDKMHTIWRHRYDYPLHVVGEPVHLTDRQFSLCEEYFNHSSSRLRQRLKEIEAELDDANDRNEYLLKVINWVVAENERLSRKVDALTNHIGDTPLNDIMTYFSD